MLIASDVKFQETNANWDLVFNVEPDSIFILIQGKKIKNVSTSKKIFRFRLKLALGAPIFFSKSWNSVEMNNKLKLSKLTWTPQFLFENEIELTDRCTGLFITPMLALIT